MAKMAAGYTLAAVMMGMTAALPAALSGQYYTESRCLLQSTVIPITEGDGRLFSTPLAKPAAAAPCLQLITQTDKRIGTWKIPTDAATDKVQNIFETTNMMTALLKGKGFQISQLDDTLSPGRYLISRFYYHFEVLESASAKTKQDFDLCVSSGIASTPENCYISLETVIGAAKAPGLTLTIDGTTVPRDSASSKSILGSNIHLLAVDVTAGNWNFVTVKLDFEQNANPPVRVKANPALDFSYARETSVNKTCLNYFRKLKEFFGQINNQPEATFEHFLKQTMLHLEVETEEEKTRMMDTVKAAMAEKVPAVRRKRFLGMFSWKTDQLDRKQQLHQQALLTLRDNAVKAFAAQSSAANLLQGLQSETTEIQKAVVSLSLKTTHDRNLARLAFLRLAEANAYVTYLDQISNTVTNSLQNLLQLIDLLVHSDAGRPSCFFHNNMAFCREQNKSAFIDHAGQMPRMHFFASSAQMERGLFPYCLPTRLADGSLALSRYHGKVLRQLDEGQLASAEFVIPRHCFSDIQTPQCRPHYVKIENTTGLPSIQGLLFAPAQAGGLRLMTTTGAIELRDQQGQTFMVTEVPRKVDNNSFPLMLGRRELTREEFITELADTANPSLYMRSRPPSSWSSQLELRPPPSPRSSTPPPQPLSLDSIGGVFSSSDPAKKAAGFAAIACGAALLVFAVCCIYCSCRHSTVCKDLRALWSAVSPLCCYVCQSCTCNCRKPTDLGAHLNRLQKITGRMMNRTEPDNMSGLRSRAPSFSASQGTRDDIHMSAQASRTHRSARVGTKPDYFGEGEEMIPLNLSPSAPSFSGDGATPP